MNDEAQRLIAELRLTPHPEGGYFRETYRAAERVTNGRGTSRSALTSILFLLTADVFSAFHRLTADEAWHFYRGDPIAIEILENDGSHRRVELASGGPWQTVVAGGAAFASHVLGDYALVGCDVAPGFEFDDFELCDRAALSSAYPTHGELIERLTRRATV